MKILVSHVTTQQKVISAKADFSNQVDRVLALCTVVNIFSQLSLAIDQWVYDQSVQGGRDGSYTWAQQHRLPLTKAHLLIATTKCQICHQQRKEYDTVLWGDQPVT